MALALALALALSVLALLTSFAANKPVVSGETVSNEIAGPQGETGLPGQEVTNYTVTSSLIVLQHF